MRSKWPAPLVVAGFLVTAATAPTEAATTVKTEYAPYGDQGTTLFVTSSPSAARVTVDGRDVGSTPIFFNDLPPGRHNVTVGDIADEVELRPGGVTHLDVRYSPSPSRSTAPTAPAERPETWWTCANCSGTGHVTCPTCWGLGGRVRCQLCRGTGRVGDDWCPICEGMKFVKCPDCHGTANVTCPKCDGRGKGRGLF